MSSVQSAPTQRYSYQERQSCLGCGSSHPLIEILDLGTPYLSDFITSEWRSHKRFPLKLVWCEQCKLAQLAHEAPLDWHFRQYWYKSGITRTMRDHLRGIVEEASSLVNLQAGDAVLDIGANDGTLLRMYPKEVKRWGFEPARNLVEEAEQGGNNIVPDYFREAGRSYFKIVTAISMFYDAPKPLEFLQTVERCLADDGIFILQMNYVKSMLEQNAFDNIGHEHLAYYSLTSLLPLLEQAGLFAFKVSTNDLNGGSFRVYCSKKRSMLAGNFFDESVERVLLGERELYTLATYRDFCQRVQTIREKVRAYLATVKERLSDEAASGTTGQFVWKHVYVYGASTRGSTTLQYFDLPDLQYAVERDPRKIGRVTTGTWLKIISEEQGRKEASIFLVLPWAFKKEIVEREHDFLQRGGQLLFPLPVPTVVTREGEREL